MLASMSSARPGLPLRNNDAACCRRKSSLLSVSGKSEEKGSAADGLPSGNGDVMISIDSACWLDESGALVTGGDD